VDLGRERPPLTPSVSERPCASAVARRQALASPHVTNLRHIAMDIDDTRLRRCLTLADGTRSIEQLALALSQADAGESEMESVTVAQAEHCLKELAARALLAA
jgi:hypothetical protein